MFIIYLFFHITTIAVMNLKRITLNAYLLFNYITSNLTSYLFILPRTVLLVLHLTNDIILVIFKKYVSLVVPVSVLREQEKNWPCYECNRRFMSSEQLQQHLNMHDDKLNLIQRFECTSETWFLRCSWLYSWQWVH